MSCGVFCSCFASFKATGNVLLDMEQQLQANSIRIQVLEQENASLHSSLEKLRQRAQHNATTDSSTQQTWSASLPNTPVQKQQNYLTQMQHALQSSGEARAGYNTGVKEAGGGESGLESARSGDCVSTANPSSMQIHLQTLHLNTGPTGAKRNTKTQSASLVSHSRGLNQKRK
ncbi:coiled-coil domain-containing protein 157-like [Anabas testudineus]|uniref:coiled-coil domain-containing protein 157-like n=1 Tax=Anabas testudineus TaxID=64144 RepID=UPI000E45CB0B|nr:coiled-coil domain-containing protein 157-like [Anabas testudineus]